MTRTRALSKSLGKKSLCRGTFAEVNGAKCRIRRSKLSLLSSRHKGRWRLVCEKFGDSGLAQQSPPRIIIPIPCWWAPHSIMSKGESKTNRSCPKEKPLGANQSEQPGILGNDSIPRSRQRSSRKRQRKSRQAYLQNFHNQSHRASSDFTVGPGIRIIV